MRYYSVGFIGFVVGVLEEGRRPYVVTIPPEERAGAGPGGGAMVTVTAVPMDPRVPKIRIKTRQLAQVRFAPPKSCVIMLGDELHEPFIVGVA